MDFIQRMIRYFAVVRRQLRRHRRLVVAAAAVVVFATTYALVLPAITLDEQSASDAPGIELAGTGEEAADAVVDVPAEEEQVAEPAADAADDAEPASEPADATAVESEPADAPADPSQPAAAELSATEGDYKVTVSYDESAGLAGGASLRVTELAQDSQEYAGAKSAVLDQKARDGQDVTDDGLGMTALDVAILDANGNEVEPAAGAKVNVKIELASLPEDVSTEALKSSLEVQHIENDGTVDTVATTPEASVQTDGSVEVDGSTATAQFDVDSFSTFTITWSILQNEKAVYTVHLVDTNGNDVEAPSVESVRIDNLTPVTFADHASLEGYEYQGAHLDSFDGQEVTDVDFEAQLSLSGLLRVVYRDGDDEVAEDDVQLIASPDDEARRDVYFVYKKVMTSADGSVRLVYDADAGIDDAGVYATTPDVDHGYIKTLWSALEQGDVEVSDFRFVDISLSDGVEPQSSVKTTVQLASPLGFADGNDIKVVHFKSDGSVETIDASYDASDGQVDSVTFDADSFSVYAITETADTSKTKTYRRTYTFQNDDGSDYTFSLTKNPAASGNETPVSITTSQQIVKNGGQLLDVGIPAAKKTYHGTTPEFLGWGVVTGSGDEEVVDTTKLITDLTNVTVTGLTSDESVTLRAVFADQVNIIFHDETGAIIATQKATVSQEADISGVTTDGTGDVALVGWTTTETLRTEDGSGNYTSNTTATATYTTSIPASNVTKDINLWPVFRAAHWLIFDSNDGGDGSATYIAPVRYTNEQTTVAPSNPQRQGYTFAGWYTAATGGSQFTFGSTLSADTTVYAHWTPAQANYTVIVWRQRVTDDKSAEDSAKTYDYGGSYSISSSTGTVILPGDSLFSGNQNLKSLSGGDYTGFHYASTGVTRTDSTTTVTVKGDGSSVINVYYDRDLITMNFQYSGGYQYTYTEVSNPSTSSQNTYYGYIPNLDDYVQLTYSSYYGAWIFRYSGRNYYYSDNGNGKYYTRSQTYVSAHTTTFTGLYGQQLSKYEYSWPADDGPWYYTYSGGSMYMSFLGQFVLPGDQTGTGNSSTAITFNQGSGTNNDIRFYLQNVDGSWPTEPSYTGAAPGTNFNFSEKFDNFNVYQFRKYGGGSQWSSDAWTDWASATVGGETSMDGYDVIEIRYSRKQYNVEFYNGSTHLDGSDVTKYYEASLSDVTTPTADTDFSYPGNSDDATHYTFVGWFADPELTTYVSFGADLTDEQKAALQQKYPSITGFVNYSTMPGHNLPVYAGWKPIRYTVTLNPNGGQVKLSEDGTATGETISFTVDYKEQIPSTIQRQVESLEDEIGSSRPGYELIGWNLTTADGTPWNFDSGVTEDVTLVAKWRATGQYRVRYVNTSPEGTPNDTLIQTDTSNYYRDNATVTTLAWPTGEDAVQVPEGYEFAGWSYNGHVYSTGEQFTVDVSSSGSTRDNGINYITLTAVYTKVGTTYLTYDANGGTGTLTDPSGISNNTQANIPLNQTTTLSDGTGFTRTGYVLVGWNSDKDAATAGTIEWNLGEQVGVDGAKGNTLYAVWRKPVSLKKTDNNSTTPKVLSGATFKLTKLGTDDSTYVNVAASDFYNNVEAGNSGCSVTSTNTTAIIGALKAGTYKLTETTAPAGYVVSTSDVTFTVDANGKVTLSGSPSNASVDTNGLLITITNTPGEALPNSGGTGTNAFTIVGAALVTLATIGTAMRRRTERRDAR